MVDEPRVLPFTSSDGANVDRPLRPRRTGHCWRRTGYLARLFFAVLLMYFGTQPGSARAQDNTFTSTGSMLIERLYFTMTRLPNGKVLATGGIDNAADVNVQNTAELYDPANGTWSFTGVMRNRRWGHTATLLENGKVLVIGGLPDEAAYTSAELYNPTTGEWSPIGRLPHPMQFHTAVGLANGRVLVVTGTTADVYEPTTDTWASAGQTTGGHGFLSSCVLLADGRVLVDGDLYDPASGTWSSTNPVGIRGTGHTLTRLLDGRVLAVGGFDNTSSTTAAALFNPVSGMWTLTTQMPDPGRAGHTATLLTNGHVLVAGGSPGSGERGMATALLYDPSNETWVSTANAMPEFKSNANAQRLFGGTVLIAGGDAGSNHTTSLAAADLFQPINRGSPFSLDVTAPAALELTEGHYTPNPFTVTATVTNLDDIAATDVEAAIVLPPRLVLASGSLVQSIGSLGAREQHVVTWIVLAAGGTDPAVQKYFVEVSSSNLPGTRSAKELALPGGGLTLISIVPAVGGDTGSLTATLNGGGFPPASNVRLVREGRADIIGTNTQMSEDGSSIRTTFDLTNRSRGLWDVVVTTDGGTTASLSDGFTVEPGRDANIWIDLVGPNIVRFGRPATYYLVYGNRGDVDSGPVVFSIASSPDQPTAFIYPSTFSTVPLTPDLDRLISVYVPLVPAGQTQYLTMTAAPTDANSTTLTARFAEWSSIHVESVSTTASLATQQCPDGTTPRRNFDPVLHDQHRQRLISCGYTFPVDPPVPACRGCMFQTFPLLRNGQRCTDLDQLSDRAIDILCLTAAVCSGYNIDRTGQYCELTITGASELGHVEASGVHDFCHENGSAVDLRLSESLTDWIKEGSGFPEQMSGAGPYWRWEHFNTNFLEEHLATHDHWHINFHLHKNGFDCNERDHSLEINRVASHDPNEQVGTPGTGPERYVQSSDLLQYRVLFENLETATAAAQDVVITDQLDPAVDLATFSLGAIQFGQHLIVPPVGLKQYTTDVVLDPPAKVVVRINAALDDTTGLATWHFSSIDPKTQLPTDDPIAGFLPPNKIPPEGQGSVLFTAAPKPDLPTGTEIQSQARIVFDANQAINTPVWRNTIDSTGPSSHVLVLSPTQISPSFVVEWAGTDDGSGISNYTIFASKNGQPFTAWLTDTTDTSATFTGQPGKTYAFYSIARDQVGNVQDAPSVPDTVTRVLKSQTSNAGMETDGNSDGVPDGWKQLTDGGDRRVCSSLKAHSGSCAYILRGDGVAGADVLKQIIPHRGSAGDTIDVKLFARAKNLGGGQARALLTVKNTATGQQEKATMSLPAGTYPYQELSLAHVVGSRNSSLTAYDQLVVSITLDAPAGSKLFVDDVSVYVSTP